VWAPVLSSSDEFIYYDDIVRQSERRKPKKEKTNGKKENGDESPAVPGKGQRRAEQALSGCWRRWMICSASGIPKKSFGLNGKTDIEKTISQDSMNVTMVFVRSVSYWNNMEEQKIVMLRARPEIR
jgi:hypothetical protein